MRRLFPVLLSLAACTPEVPEDPDVPMDTADPGPPPGPGLGNLAWDASELFTPVGWFDQDNGVPPPSAEAPITSIKPFGTNSAYLHNGYLVTLFAPDSGFGPGGLLLYDVSDPRSPTLVHRVYEPEPGGRTAEFREAHAMAFSHRDGRQLVALHTGRGLQLWDLAEVTDPQVVGRLDLPGVNFGDYEGVAWQLAWQGSMVYVAGAGQGLFLVDVSDPTNPVLADLQGQPNPIPPSQLGGFRIGPVFVVGNHLIVSSMDNESGYALLDLSDARAPALLGARTGLPKFYATCFSGGHVVTAVRGGGAKMLLDDVTDPWDFTWRDTDLAVDKQLYCGTQDEFVFLGCEDEVVKVDISDPDAARVVGRGVLGRPDTDHGQVTPFGNLVFVGNDHGTGSAFVVHQAEPDTRPPEVSFVSPADGATGQGLLSRVGVTFTDAVTVERLSRRTLTVRPVGGQALRGTYTVQGHIVNFEPAEPLAPSTTYEVVMEAGGVTDWVGNPIAETFRSTFTTTSLVTADQDAVLQARVVAPGPVEVGEPVTLRLDVQGTTVGEASWRPDTEADWVHRSDLGPLTHTYDTPGHKTVVVSLSNGVRRVTTTAQVTVHRPLTPQPPTRGATLALDEARGLVWTVDHDHDSVSALDATSLARVHEVPVCAGPRNVDVAADGAVWVSCEEDGRLAVIDGDEGQVVASLPLGHGVRPAGLVADPAGTTVFVALEGVGQLVAFDATLRTERARLHVGPTPFGVAVSGDGATVWATRRISPDEGGQVYEADAALTGSRVLTVPADDTTVDGEDRARGVPNYLLVPSPTPDGHALWLPAKQDNIFRGGARDGQPLTHESTVRAVLPRVLLATGQEQPGRRLDLNDRAPPVDVAFTPWGDYAFVALQGSNQVAIHDAYTGQPVGAWRGGHHAVQGLAVSADGTSLYAHHFLSRNVTRHDLTGLLSGASVDAPEVAVGGTVSEEALPADVLRGKQIFYRASDVRMSKDGYIACASCHLGGGHDGRTWDFTDRGEGLRNTTDLRGRAGMAHGPLHWTANFDEVQDFENDIRGAFGGVGFLRFADWQSGTVSDPLGDPKAGLSADLDALAAYVASLDTFPTSPWRPGPDQLTEAAARGEVLFEALDCGSCHGGEAFTVSSDGVRYDVGTLTSQSGMRRGEPLDGLDVPTLRGVWDTPPYLHDGSAERLVDVFLDFNPTDAHGVTSPLGEDALDDLVAFLASLE